MNIKRLIYIIEVSRWQNFTKAAEVLNISQPFLSQQISRLETELNHKLIDRTTRQFRLTDFGIIFVEKAEILLNEIKNFEDFVDSYDSIVKGKLSIGVIPSVGTLKIGVMISSFQKTYPKVNITINEGPTRVLMDSLSESNIHVAISTPFGGMLKEKRLLHQTIIDDNIVALLSNKHPLASKSEISLSALQNEQLILPQKDTGAYSILWNAFQEQGIPLSNYCESSQIDLTMDLVRNKFGVAFFSSRIAKNCGENIQQIPLIPPIQKPLIMTSLRKNEHYLPLKTFWEFARQWANMHTL